MEYIFSILAGIAGTAIMTSYIYAASYISKKRMKVTKILGTMLTHQTTPKKGLSSSTESLLMGILIHYLIGIVFSISYLIIWKAKLAKPDLLGSIVLGIISGIIGVAGWRIYYRIHSNPPAIPFKSYQFHIFIGHIAFAVSNTYIFKFLTLL